MHAALLDNSPRRASIDRNRALRLHYSTVRLSRIQFRSKRSQAAVGSGSSIAASTLTPQLASSNSYSYALRDKIRQPYRCNAFKLRKGKECGFRSNTADLFAARLAYVRTQCMNFLTSVYITSLERQSYSMNNFTADTIWYTLQCYKKFWCKNGKGSINLLVPMTLWQ